jgi:hypothetical protein
MDIALNLIKNLLIMSQTLTCKVQESIRVDRNRMINIISQKANRQIEIRMLY